MDDLTKRERLRRVALLCCHCARNIAYYREWHDRLAPGEYGEILATIDGNFLDMSVMEWCKLFSDKRGKHHWRKVVNHPDFEADMLKQLDERADQFENYIDDMRAYRDKFLAHLDDERTMNIPSMELARKSVTFFYEYLVSFEASNDDLAGLPKDLTVYYNDCFAKARSFLDCLDLKPSA